MTSPLRYRHRRLGALLIAVSLNSVASAQYTPFDSPTNTRQVNNIAIASANSIPTTNQPSPTVQASPNFIYLTPPLADVVPDTVNQTAQPINDADATRQELEALKQRLQELEASTAKLSTSMESKKSGDAKSEAGESKDAKSKDKDSKSKDKDSAAKSDKKDDGWVDTSTEKWTVKLGGHVQMDFVQWASGSSSIPDQQNYFNFRRLRLNADGTGYGVYDFRLQMTLEPDGAGESPAGSVTTGQVKDAYFSMNEIPGLGRFRIGNFFVPFGLEQVTNDTMNIFLERSIPTQGVFTADREVGVALYNANEAQDITWSTGFFLDSISEATKKRLDDNQGYRMSGRVTWIPYFDEPSNGRYVIHTGMGVLYTQDQDQRVRFRARPQVSEGPRIIDSGTIDAHDYTTGNLEGAIVWGRVTLQSEAYLTTIDRLNGDRPTVNGTYAHLSYFLTGENRVYERFGQHGSQFGRNTPNSNFFATRGGISPGAWELKTRWSHLDLNNLNAGQYNDLTIGVNWYWSDRVRWMFDWIHPITSSTAVFGATQSNLLATRFDFNW